MKNKQKFYNQKAKFPKIKQRGILGFLLHRLTKYYIDRKKVAIEFLPSDIKNILDIGSDRGVLLFEVASRIFQKGYGIDLSDSLVKMANKEAVNKKLNGKIKFLEVDIDEGIPFPKESFDVVTCLAVMEHVFDPLFVFQEIARVTKPGGSIIIEVPNLAWLPRRLTLLLGKRPRTSWAPGWDGGHLQYFTLSDLKELFEKNGIEIEEIKCSGILAWLKNLWPSMLGADFVVLGIKK